MSTTTIRLQKADDTFVIRGVLTTSGGSSGGSSGGGWGSGGWGGSEDINAVVAAAVDAVLDDAVVTAVNAAVGTIVNAGLITHVNEYHRNDVRRYDFQTGGADNGQALLTAIAAIFNTPMPTFKLQLTGTGEFQKGNAAPGGGELFFPRGEWTMPDFEITHRMGLVGETGAALIRKPGETGDWIKNRRDLTVHAKYGKIKNLTLHANGFLTSNAPTGTAVHFYGEPGFGTPAYTNPLDEDYDEAHLMDDVYILGVKSGRGIDMEGSGGVRLGFIKIRNVDLEGIVFGQDNTADQLDIAWTGKQCVLVVGDSCRIGVSKLWYPGRSDAANGQGMKVMADSGAFGVITTQDSKAQGVLFDNAFGCAVGIIEIDSASMDSPGTYPGFDCWVSGGINASSVVVRNRYRTDGSTGPCRDAVAIANTPTGFHNTIYAEAVKGVFGVVNNLKAGSNTTGQTVVVNGVAV